MKSQASPTSPLVYIILVNWQGWRDTIECLESVFRLDYPNFKVVVCDNESGDRSIEKIKAWASGELPAESRSRELAGMTEPAIRKPLEYDEISSKNGKQRGHACLTLLHCGGNLGFAGGSNSGLRFALGDSEMQYAWLLNNDTVVDRNALTHLVARLEERSDAGFCGSTLLYYYSPAKVQALGGSIFNPWTARGGHIGNSISRDSAVDRDEVERELRYVVGASTLVRRKVLEEIGLMNESYFLYYEEIDWALRAKGRFALAYAPNSVVYHKEGATIGSAARTVQQSVTAEYYMTRNRLLLTRRTMPRALPTVVACVIASFAHRAILGRFRNAGAVFRGAIDGFRVKVQESCEN